MVDSRAPFSLRPLPTSLLAVRHSCKPWTDPRSQKAGISASASGMRSHVWGYVCNRVRISKCVLCHAHSALPNHSCCCMHACIHTCFHAFIHHYMPASRSTGGDMCAGSPEKILMHGLLLSEIGWCVPFLLQNDHPSSDMLSYA